MKRFEKAEYVKINGIEQFLYHSGTDYKNPVMLFLHGGPGRVESNYAYKMQDEWEKYYTIVHFDQRGSGKTLIRNPKVYPSMNDLILDIKFIIEYLKYLYDTKKIILLGYSFGSVLGSLYIKGYPEDVLFYIGVGQLVNMQINEKVLYKKLKDEFEKLGKKRHLKKLKAIGVYPEKVYSNSMKRKYSKVESLVAKSSIKSEKALTIMLNFIRSPLFKISDLFAMILSERANKRLMKFLVNVDLREYGADYQVPIVYILGENDYTAVTSIAKAYFKKIETSKKLLYIVQGAKHRPMIENKEAFDKIIIGLKEEFISLNSEDYLN